MFPGQEQSKDKFIRIPLWIGLESVQCDDIGPFPVAGPANIHAFGSDSTLVCRLGF